MTQWNRETEVNGMTIDNWGLRLFKFGEVTKPNSPFGYLPKFRFWMMDPNGMGLLGYSKPAADGSSRELLDQMSHKRRIQCITPESNIGNLSTSDKVPQYLVL